MQSNELAKRTQAGMEYRAEPLRVRIDLPNLQTRDRHDLRCAFACSVQIAQSKSDRELFAEILLGDRAIVKREEAADHLARHIRAGVAAFVAGHDAGELIAGPVRDDLLGTIHRAMDATAFACGLIVLPPFELEVESASLSREKLEEAERDRAESRSANQVEHLRRAGELMKQFRSLREASGSISPGEILEQISSADRGSTLEAMLLAASQNAPPAILWAVAGSQLVKVDPRDQSISSITVPTTLGPLRSVQSAGVDSRELLLIGAQTGVFALDPKRPAEIAREFSLADQPASSPHGFNRAVFDPSTGTVWASHKDHGLIGWNFESGDRISAPATQIIGAGNLQLLSPGTIAFTTPSGLTIQRGESSRSIASRSCSSIVAFVLDDSSGYLIFEDGTIEVIDRAGGESIRQRASRRPARICAAGALPWLGSIRLLLSREDSAIECVGTDDQLVTQYLSPHRACRMLAAKEDIVAAVSSDRQRVILWHSWGGRKPFAEIHVTSQTRHRIADLAFA